MKYPWHLLIDERTSGVLIGVKDPVIANQLRRGVLDAHHVSTRATYDGDQNASLGFAKGAFFELPKSAHNEHYVEKKRRLQTRLPGFLLWRELITDHVNREKTFYIDIEWSIMRELDQSTPEKPSPSLLDYAEAAGLSIVEAYEYLKLKSYERSNRMLVVHALAEKHARILNECTDQAEIEAACRTMRREFGNRGTP